MNWEKPEDKEHLLRLLRQSCASVEVQDRTVGERSVGTAFHVGEGIYLTARHVLEGNEIIGITPETEGHLERDELISEPEVFRVWMPNNDDEGFRPIYYLDHSTVSVCEGPFFHSNPKIDVAAFKVSGIDMNTPLVNLGYLNDEETHNQWLLTRAIVCGYPPIPTSLESYFVVDEVIINSMIDTYRDKYLRYIVSGIPRGGFSGGPAFHQWGFAIGMVTESLQHMGDKVESGYLSIIGSTALRECLVENGIMPDAQLVEGYAL